MWEFCFIYIGENCFIYIGEENNTFIIHVRVYMNIDYYKYAFIKICWEYSLQAFYVLA